MPCPSCRLTAVDHDGVLQASYQGLIRDLSSAEALLFVIAGHSNQPAAVHHSQGTVAFIIDGRCSRQRICSSNLQMCMQYLCGDSGFSSAKHNHDPAARGTHWQADCCAALPEQLSLCRQSGSMVLRLCLRGFICDTAAATEQLLHMPCGRSLRCASSLGTSWLQCTHLPRTLSSAPLHQLRRSGSSLPPQVLRRHRPVS